MSTGIFANETTSACTAPLLDESLFPQKGGYLPGRYCGLGSFQIDGGTASCCFPCPIQDYIYAPNWRTRLRIPNYLSILSVTLCTFLLLSFLALPPSKTHRHYLSVGLLIPVLLVKMWIICQTLSHGDKKECRKYVKGFTVREADVLVALILASLVGIEIFILLFGRSMAQAWLDLFKRLPSLFQTYQPLGRRPQTPELTTFENPDKYSLPSPAERRHGSRFVEGLDIVPSSIASSASETSNIASAGFTSSNVLPSPPAIHITSPTGATTSSLKFNTLTFSHAHTSMSPTRLFHPTRSAPMPPLRTSSVKTSSLASSSAPSTSTSIFSTTSWRTKETERSWRDSTISALGRVSIAEGADGDDAGVYSDHRRVVREGDLPTTTTKTNISGPMPGTFQHLDGAFVQFRPASAS
ncbi:AAA-16 domain containing protein [Pyrenophora tritici-repentis]|nr:AAA-16 domain containing protein [Pyrenophora tritici-repentis]